VAIGLKGKLNFDKELKYFFQVFPSLEQIQIPSLFFFLFLK